MSKISISIVEPCNNIEAIKLIRRVTGDSLDVIKRNLAAGKSGIFYTAELFLNDHIQIDRQISLLLEGLEKLDLPLFIAEIPYDEKWSNVECLDDVRISPVDLLAMLDNAKENFS